MHAVAQYCAFQLINIIKRVCKIINLRKRYGGVAGLLLRIYEFNNVFIEIIRNNWNLHQG